jgi:multicomponent K+:H+ antiporter subunit F
MPSLAPSFIALALLFALGAVGLAMLLCGWRLLRGPTLPDRVLALDTLYVNVVAFVVLLGIRQGTGLYFEAALLIALLGFVSTVALGRYLQRGDVIE